jgi:hypothetical protein
MELKKMMKLTEIAKLTKEEQKDVLGGREPMCPCSTTVVYFVEAMGGGCNCGSIFSIYGLSWG